MWIGEEKIGMYLNMFSTGIAKKLFVWWTNDWKIITSMNRKVLIGDWMLLRLVIGKTSKR